MLRKIWPIKIMMEKKRWDQACKNPLTTILQHIRTKYHLKTRTRVCSQARNAPATALPSSMELVERRCWPFSVPLSVGNKENILKNMNHLTTSGSTFFARSWMALITIHIDDRRNMTPKITQALGKRKKIEKNKKKC